MSGRITTELPNPFASESDDTGDLAASAETELALVLLDGEQPGRALAIKDEVVIGRAPDCDLCIDREEVSRQHARLVRPEARTVVLRDLGSRNGSFVNGRRVTEQVLTIGDRITLGTATLLFTFRDHAGEQLLHHQRIEAMGRLAGGVAHDFNNLLGVIIGNVEVLARMDRGTPLAHADVREIVDDLRTAALRASEVTQQLLAFSRRSPGEQATIDVSQLVGEAVRLCRRTFAAEIAIEARVVPRVQVLGDRAQLHQVVMNLLINARDAMPTGGQLVVEVGRRAGPTRAGELASIRVKDTGIGMAPEVRAHVFEPFFTTKARGHGTGLGLSTVYGIVKAHGGEITVQSEPGRGSTFEVTLPSLSELRQEARTPVSTNVTLSPGN